MVAKLTKPLVGKLAVVSSLVTAQNLSGTLLLILLPAVMRDIGIPLEHFFLLTIAGAPVWFKWLIAPIVDRTGSRSFGMRRSWIVPMTTLGFVSYILLGYITPTVETIYMVLAALFLKNLVMAIQDVAVDGYNVENVGNNERGIASFAIELGTYVSLSIPTMVLMPLYEEKGWAFVVWLAGSSLLVLTMSVLLRAEAPPSQEKIERLKRSETEGYIEGSWNTLKDFILRAESKWVILFLGVSGVLGTFISGLVPAFIFDLGFSFAEIGMAAGLGYIIGGPVGGFASQWLLTKIGLRNLILVSAVCATTAVGSLAYLAFLGEGNVHFYQVAVVAASSIALMTPLGIITGALRLKWAATGSAGTDYTIQSSVTLGFRTVGTGLAGVAAGLMGYFAYYVLGIILIGAMMVMMFFVIPIINKHVKERRVRDGTYEPDELEFR